MARLALASQESMLQFLGVDAAEINRAPILGETFDKKVDGERLVSQQRRVEDLMIDGEWRSLHDIAVKLRKIHGVPFPEASISARLRDLRRSGFKVERIRQSPFTGLWIYRVTKPEVAA